MHPALADLRRLRRLRRLGEIEWFDVAYKAYLAAVLGGSAVIALSGLVGDTEVTPAQASDVFRDGPAVLGLIAIAAVALGVRSGADGGPVSIEPADVRHVLLAPIDRRSALMRPYSQRLRSVAFGAAVVGAIAGQLAAQRLPGSPVAWAASGAIAGACVGALFVASATIAHAVRMSRPLATAIGAVLVAAQLLTLWAGVTGPADTFGGLVLWGWDQQAVDLAAIATTIVVCAIGGVLVGRLRIDPLVRRGDLVSQLRFAVTMQDLRTVVLLRRQLRNEQPRRRPWLRLAPSRGTERGAVTRRAWHGIARTPLGRLGRMTLLAAAAGAAVVAFVRGTTPAVVVVGVVLFLLGLEAIEPLSQEIDHPERTDGLPHERGWLHVRLLLPPALLLVPFALFGAGVAGVLEPEAAAGVFALAVPVVWLGAAGAVVSTVRDAAVAAASQSSVMVPPEIAGIGNTIRMLVPLAVSMLAAVPVLVMRATPDFAMAIRSVVGATLALGLLIWWVIRRDRLRRWIDTALAGAKP